MNHIYRVVFARALGRCVVTSELAKSPRGGLPGAVHGQPIALSTGPGVFKALFSALLLAGSIGLAHAAPLGGQVLSGSGSIGVTGNTTTITQTSPTLHLSWQSFNVGADQTVTFHQPTSQSLAVNNILSTTPSLIDGHITANGQVWLINPEGLIFGKTASVNTAGFVASTLTPTPTALGTTVFEGPSTGSVTNDGSLTATAGGYVALLGENVANNGVIEASLGTVALAGGSAVDLTFTGNHLVNVAVDKSTLNTLVANHDLIIAPGGTVIMTAGAANTLAAAVVNNTGVIQAQTVADHNGTITLLGSGTDSTVTVGGTLNASAPQGGNGGFINTSAQTVNLLPGAVVTASAASGAAGTWLLDPTDLVIDSTAATTIDTTLNTGTSGTNVTEQTTSTTASGTGTQVSGTGSIDVNAPLTWSTAATLTLDAYNNVNVAAPITVTGTGTLAITTGDVSTTATTTNNGTGTLNFPGGDIQFTGTNTSGDPTGTLTINNSSYTLLNAANLNATDVTTSAGDYALADDVTLSTSTNFTPLFESTAYTGTFNGLGNTISNLTESTSDEYAGLFGQVGVGGVIKNVGLVGGAVSAASSTNPPPTNYVGDLVGYNSGTLTNDYATGTVHGSAQSVSVIGGLVGYNDGALTDDYATGAVSGNPGTAQQFYKVGGLVGYNQSGALTNDYATGNVQGGAAEYTFTGGLVGWNENGSLTNDYATGDINLSYIPDAYHGDDTGGLVGYNDSGQLQYDYATGTVQAGRGGGPTIYAPSTGASGNFTGGLVGSDNTGTLTDDYATGNVTGGPGGQLNSIPDTGGLVGANDGTLSYDYATGNVSGAPAGGFVGISATSLQDDYWDTTSDTTMTSGSYDNQASGITGETTPKLSAALPAGFSPTVWGNLNNQTTPYLLSNNGPVYMGTTLLTLIFTMNELQAINTNLSANYALAQDLNATGYTFTPIGETTAYTGIFNGLGNTISDLTESTSDMYAGLFGQVGNGTAGVGVVENVGLVGESIKNTDTGISSDTGGLVGYDNYGTLTNDYATGAVTGGSGAYNDTGGLVGYNYDGTLTNDYATGAVTGGIGSHSITGGLVGWNNGTLTESYAAGSITGGSGAYNDTGGLVGRNSGTLTNDDAIGTVTSTGASSITGGLVGWNNGALTNDYATGAVTGSTGTKSDTGGLVGDNDHGTLTNDYATGAVTAEGTGTSFGSSDTGGLVGDNNGGSLSDDYATGTVKGGIGNFSATGGLVGFNSGILNYDYATGTVTGGTESKSYTGGLVGFNYGGVLMDVYATGAVTGGGTGDYSETGGLVGFNEDMDSAHPGDITDAYATGAVTGGTGFGSDTGGLVGYNSGGTLTDNYWDTSTNAGMVGVGNNGSALGVTGLTNTQMLQSSSFAGFDFTSTLSGSTTTPPTWVIYNGHTRPLLASFLTPLTVTADSVSSPYTGLGSTALLAHPTYSVTGAATSGNLFGLTVPYAADINAGTYSSPTLWSDQQGYDITYVRGALTISPATLTYTAAPVHLFTGESLPTSFTGTLSGLGAGQTPATVTTGSLDWTTTASAHSPVGVYAIDGRGLTVISPNYVSTILEAPTNSTAFTISAGTLSAIAGSNPAYAGLLGIDGASDTTRLFTPNVGDYSLTPPIDQMNQIPSARSVYGTYTVSHPEPLLQNTPVKTPLLAGLDIEIMGGGVRLPAFLTKTAS
ncbi:MAG: two-partner secretion domain-containing protein [Acidiferrobacter sp.]